MRLIDVDALIETMRENAEGNEGWYGDTWAFMRDVENAPTIDAVPRWIPCEDRLPKPNVAVLGYAPAFHNIFTVCYDSVCGWMTWCPACDEPFPSWQGEIVAWMPLPEPYEGERKDNE